MEVDFQSKEWKKKSRDCVDFTRRLLLRDPKKRFTAAEALSHTWLEKMRVQREKKGSSKASIGKAETEMLKALNNLRSLKASSKI